MAERLSPRLQPSVADLHCEKHLEPLQLFCDTDQVTLCTKCVLSQEHRDHAVYTVAEATENYQNSFQDLLNELRKKLEVAQSMLADEQERMLEIQADEQNFKEMVESEYRTRSQLLKDNKEVDLLRPPECSSGPDTEEARPNHPTTSAAGVEKLWEALQSLGDAARENRTRLQASTARLSEQVRSLQGIVAKLEKKCQAPAAALLHNARYSLERGESLLLRPLEPAHVTELSLRPVAGVCLMLRGTCPRHITLDPETAHPCLTMCDDLRSVRLGNTLQDVPGTPGRLDFSATVLGVERFSSGRHYWEVDVGKATNWQLGVCMARASRPGHVPEGGGDQVLLTKAVMGTECTFWVFPPLKRISLRENMFRVGVFLDCEHGQVAFYNVTEQSLIYRLSGLPLRGTVRPAFSMCVPNEDTRSDSLTLCPLEGPSHSAPGGPVFRDVKPKGT